LVSIPEAILPDRSRVFSERRKEHVMRTDLLVFSKTLSVERTNKVRVARAVIGFFALVEIVDKAVSALHLADFFIEVVKSALEFVSRQGKPPFELGLAVGETTPDFMLGWQSGYAQVCKTCDVGSTPAPNSK
jgi:hypothetical protein